MNQISDKKIHFKNHRKDFAELGICLPTNNYGCQKTHSFEGRVTLHPQRLQQILGKCNGCNCITSRHNHDERRPHVQKCQLRTKSIIEICVIATRFGYHGTCRQKKLFSFSFGFDISAKTRLTYPILKYNQYGVRK